MKTSTITAFFAPAVAVRGQWWNGAPECAQDCFSSYWSSATNQNDWPAPTAYCTSNSVASCVSSVCSATPTAVTSYVSLSSSLCSRWSSCSAASSSPSVFTVSAPAFTGAWGGPGGSRGPKGGHWTGGVYTVTGCEWNGNPWAGGPGGWGNGGAAGGPGPWGYWGKDWKWSTETKTVTRIETNVNNGVTSFATSVGLATVALAVSGDSTTTSFVQAQETGKGSSNAAGGGRAAEVDGGMKVMGVVLGGVAVVAGLL